MTYSKRFDKNSLKLSFKILQIWLAFKNYLTFEGLIGLVLEVGCLLPVRLELSQFRSHLHRGHDFVRYRSHFTRTQVFHLN